MTGKKFAHGGNIYAAGGGRVLDFSANINPVGLSPAANRAIVENIPLVTHYPDPRALALRQAIRRFYRVADDRLVLGNGASELLYLLCHVLRPGKVILPAPSFSEYERAALSVKALINYFYLLAEDDFSLCLTKLAAAAPENALLFLGNPNNPTGVLLEREYFEDFLLKVKNKGCNVVVDESFIDFLPDADEHSCRGFIEKYDNLFIIHSLTKFFAIPGLRLGFGLFPPEVAEKLKNAADCWNVNNLAQAAGTAALADGEYIAASKEAVGYLRGQLTEQLLKLGGVKIFPSAVNFILLDISGWGFVSGQLCALLAGRGVLARDCAAYPGLDERYIRIAVRAQAENEEFLKILGEEIRRG